MSLYVYHIPPIDYFGERYGWTDMKKLLDEAVADEYESICLGLSKEELTLRWWKAQRLARKIGWEGDIRDGPWLAAIPVECGDWDFIIAWKQDNNGTTFVATPYILPWLDDIAAEPIKEL